MAFTPKDRAELARARRVVEGLEAKERDALEALRVVLCEVRSLAHNANWEPAEIAAHADAIRDALEPFDSGVREAAPKDDIPF